MSTKTRIEPMPHSESTPYTHLEPLVDALLRNGNRLRVAPKFHRDRDGWRCDLAEPIDFDLIQREFELPRSILLSRENDAILDQNTWIEIKGGRR